MKSVIAESLHFNQILIVKFERSCSGVQNLKLHKLCLCPVNYERFRCQELFGLLSSNTSQSSLNVSLLFHLSVCWCLLCNSWLTPADRSTAFPFQCVVIQAQIVCFSWTVIWTLCMDVMPWNIYVERDRTEQNGWSLHLESKVFLTKLHGNEI